MALPPAEEPGLIPDEKKKKAFLRLVVTLLVIDTLAVIGYLVLVYVFGWEGMVPFVILLGASVFTGMYFQAGMQKVDRM
jgi:CHASE2 domain-containing sensor protein